MEQSDKIILTCDYCIHCEKCVDTMGCEFEPDVNKIPYILDKYADFNDGFFDDIEIIPFLAWLFGYPEKKYEIIEEMNKKGE